MIQWYQVEGSTFNQNKHKGEMKHERLQWLDKLGNMELQTLDG
jgi:hypothetical protein